MNSEGNVHKALRQILEVDAFFVGDFALRGGPLVEAAVDPEPAPHAEGEDATEMAAGKMDPQTELNRIAEEVSHCVRCDELAATRTHTVPGEGDPRAKLVFVGEAPGGDEDKQGRPFVGRAGQLLDKIIAAMGLRREQVFICNTLKCRPPGNRDPKTIEKQSCRPYLRRQLEVIRPEIIVALGSHAAKELLEVDLPIGRLRGRFHEFYFSPDLPPVKLMPTYHPAYLLRNYSTDNRQRVWDDMQKVMAELGIEPPKKNGSRLK